MDAEVFAEAVQIPLERAEHWLPHLEAAMRHYSINSTQAQAAFLAQTCHETGCFRHWVENMRYSTPERIYRIWPSRFASVNEARPFVRSPEALANRVYSRRLGNGSEASGEGWLYIGRGCLQITGKNNYRAAQEGMQLPLLEQPELLELEEYAAASAAWWWYERHLNYFAERGDIDAVSGIINQGDPHKDAVGKRERAELYEHALWVLES